jgi:hypothetical protein
MYSDPISPDVAALARAHSGIIGRASAVWETLTVDLIRKAPSNPHGVTVTPALNTLFLTRTRQSLPVIKRLPGCATAAPKSSCGATFALEMKGGTEEAPRPFVVVEALRLARLWPEACMGEIAVPAFCWLGVSSLPRLAVASQRRRIF